MAWIVGLIVGCLLLLAGGPDGASEPDVASERPNLIFISLDTTRADALSCYGEVPGLLKSRGEVTPNLDRLAAAGVRFDNAHAHAPTTLSSHASMFTGLDPHGHAIPRNGFPLRDEVPTLATRLKDEGYDTIAILGAKALERSMGLDRGFRVYDDRMPMLLGPMFQDRADGVLARTEEALVRRESGRPLFLFVHFFDPHQPYLAPPDWFDRFSDPTYEGPWAHPGALLGPLRSALLLDEADPEDVDQVASLYLSEVHYVDHHVGLLLAHLEERGLLDHAVVVVVGDHGEVLGEVSSFAYSHGNDVTVGATHVPLIVRGHGVPLAERAVVRSQVALSSLAPTLEALLGLDPSLGTASSFADLARAGPVRDEDGWPECSTHTVFMEATRPHDEDHGEAWNNGRLMRGVRAGGWTLRSAPLLGREPRLEEAPDGPVESRQRPLEHVLASMLASWDEDAPPGRNDAISADTKEILRALGYLEEER